MTSDLEALLLKESYRALERELKGSCCMLAEQPNGRLRRIMAGRGAAFDSDTILRIARIQSALVIGDAINPEEEAILQKARSPLLGPREFLKNWFFIEAEIRRKTAESIKRQLIRRRVEPAPSTIADALRSTYGSAAVSETVLRAVANDIVCILFGASPIRVSS